MSNLDKIIIEFINKHKIKIFISISSMLALIIRYYFFNIESDDYKVFLLPWTKHFAESNAFSGLKTTDSNYNVPYLYLLLFISKLNINYLFSIKAISVFFDFLGAIGCYFIVKFLKGRDGELLAAITYALVLFNPIVILNSAAWAQCDMIYTSFIIFSLYYILKKDYIKAFILFGISFAFKLQAIFLLPLYVLLYFKKKSFSIFNFLIIPLVYIIIYIPSVLVGRPLWKIFGIYFGQVKETNTLVYNFPSIYNILPNKGEYFRMPGMIFTFMLIGIIVLYLMNDLRTISDNQILELAILFIVVETFFLPGMHDRYMFVAEIISIIYLILKKNFIIPIGINLMSFNCYINYLFGCTFIDIKITTIIQLCLVIILLLKTILYTDN